MCRKYHSLLIGDVEEENSSGFGTFCRVWGSLEPMRRVNVGWNVFWLLILHVVVNNHARRATGNAF